MAISQLRKAGRVLNRALSLDYISYGGCRLPPQHMRYCGKEFRNDEVFLTSGKVEAKRLIADFGMDADSALLEIGCGPGRLPIGILAEFGPIRRYEGIDIDGASVDWCSRHITNQHPGFRSHHIEAQNERYNPNGRPMSQGFQLHFADASFDIVYLHSVFSNMNPEDVSIYCAEFVRLLGPDGGVFLTAFIEENVPDVTINPDDYLIESTGPMNVVRYEKNYFFGIVRSAGLEISHFDHRGDLGGQSVMHLRPAAMAISHASSDSKHRLRACATPQ